MITLQHRGRDFPIELGASWTAPSAAETYRDAPIGELTKIIARIKSGVEWRRAVGDQYAVSNPWLNAVVTSPRRDLFFRQYPPAAGAMVLDIGAGWGQMSLPLARVGTVVALEPTPERLAFIHAAAEQERLANRMYFVQGDFFEVEFRSAFDLICCIGVLEWTPKFRAGDPLAVQVEFLKRARELLRPGGRLVIGIENRLGLKYLLGAPDDHIGVSGVSVFDLALATRKWRERSGQDLRAVTHTRAELATLLRAAGFERTEFFAAFPDYKLPEVILPLGSKVNEFLSSGRYVNEHDGSCGKPLEWQEELASHYRSLAALGVAPDFAPSFFVMASSQQATSEPRMDIARMIP